MRVRILAQLGMTLLACNSSVPIVAETGGAEAPAGFDAGHGGDFPAPDAGLGNLNDQTEPVVLPSPACPIDPWIDGRMDGWRCIQNRSAPEVLWVKSLVVRDHPRLFMQRLVNGELRVFDVPFEAGLDSTASPIFSMITNGYFVDVQSLREIEKDGERISALFGTGFKDRRYPGRFGVLLDGELTRTYDCTDEMDSGHLGAASDSEFWIKEFKTNGCFFECNFTQTETVLYRVKTSGTPQVEGPICFSAPSDDFYKHYDYFDFLHPRKRTLLSAPILGLTIPTQARIHRFDERGQVTSTILLDSTEFYSGTWMPSEETWLGYEPLGYQLDGEEQTQLRAFHVLADDTVDSHVSVLNELFLNIFEVTEIDGQPYFIGEPRRHIAPIRDSFILAHRTGSALEWTLIPMSYRYWVPEVIKLSGKPHVVVRVKRGGDGDPWRWPTLLYKELRFEHSIPLEEGSFP